VKEAIAAWPSFVASFRETFNWLKEIFTNTFDWIGQKFTDFFNWIASGTQKIYGLIDPIIDKIGSFLGKETNITATRNLQFADFPIAKPIAAPARAMQNNSAVYNNQNDNKTVNVNMTLNNVKDGKRVATDFTEVFLGVE
jgi:hypothetical protein